MICNKCGKNNAAGADFCSSCKEPMSPLSNCGGFADILSYEAAPQPASSAAPASAEPVPVPRPAPAARRAVAPSSAVKRGNEEFFSKKNILSIVAIALCIITLIVVLVVACLDDGSDEDYAPPVSQDAVDTPDNEDPTADSEVPGPTKLITIDLKDLPTIPDDKDFVTMTIEDYQTGPKEFMVNGGEPVTSYLLYNTASDVDDEDVCISLEVDAQLPENHVFYIKYDSADQAKVDMKGTVQDIFDEKIDEVDPEEVVLKKGTFDLEDGGFKEELGTQINVFYYNNDGKKLTAKTKPGEEYKKGKTRVEIEVSVSENTNEIEVNVEYSKDGRKVFLDPITVKKLTRS